MGIIHEHGKLDGPGGGTGGEGAVSSWKSEADNGQWEPVSIGGLQGAYDVTGDAAHVDKTGPSAKQRETGAVSSDFEKRGSAEERLF